MIAIKGPLTMATVGQIYREFEKKLAQSDLVLDFSGVEQIDSSAVALLVTIFRRARTAPNGVRFVSLPSSIMQFAEIYGMDDPLRS